MTATRIHKVRFRQSGGFAGLMRGCEVPGSDLRPEERRALLKTPKRVSDEAARDLLEFELEVTTTKGTSVLNFSEAGVPEPLRDLVVRLQAQSKSTPA